MSDIAAGNITGATLNPSIDIWDKVMDQVKFVKDSLLKILLVPFLNTLPHLSNITEVIQCEKLCIHKNREAILIFIW